jgi:MFS family permease
MGMSSAMIHSVLPVFLVVVLGASVTAVGAIEGTAEGTVSLAKILSGVTSDHLKRRKVLVVLGYALSAFSKLLFLFAGAASTILMARVTDRIGKGIRDAPRDALLADVTPVIIRGTGFGLRLTLYSFGAVVGPLAASALMLVGAGEFQLVFQVAMIPAFFSVLVLILGVKETERDRTAASGYRIRIADLKQLQPTFWWVVSFAALLALARFGQAFLLMRAHDVGIEPELIPLMLVLVNLVYCVSAYPFGVLSDRIDRPLQLGLGCFVLVAADVTLATGNAVWTVAGGAVLWGLQMGVTQGLLAAMIADVAPVHIRGSAFGIYDFVTGVTTFLASFCAGLLWTFAGASVTFAGSAVIALGAALLLLLRPSKIEMSARRG